MFWMLVLACQMAWVQADHQIFHVKSMDSISGATTTNTSLFGYSISYAPAIKTLIVSAPKGSDIGDIYSYKLTLPQFQPEKIPLTFDRAYSHNSLLGVTVKAGKDFFVTCAPLHYWKRTFDIGSNPSTSKSAKGTFSKCMKFDLTKNESSSLMDINKKDREKHATLFEHMMDSFGWSIDVDDQDVVIGGPAMFSGRVAFYPSTARNTKVEERKPISLTGYTSDPKDYNKIVQHNFGYSVAVGHFSTDSDFDNKKIYAIGSTYGRFGHGSVSFHVVLGQITRQNSLSDDHSLLLSDEVGTMFGAALCAAQLTPGSHYTALLVGAPAYSANDKDDSFNQGAVYVYPPSAQLPLKEYSNIIVGTKSRGFFGSAIARLGDYNGDGLDEIAIAAPYEANRGAVYIYSGAELINKQGNINYLQKLSPQRRDTSFGFSLAMIQDYDDNGCNELAIGAPESRRVYVVKCMASVKVDVETVIPKNLKLTKDNPYRTDEYFIFESCLNVVYPEKPAVVHAKIRVDVVITHDDAKLDEKQKFYEVILDKSATRICRNITVTAPKNGNYQKPIHYEITAKQLDPPTNKRKIDGSLVILSELSTLTVADTITELIECENKTHCNPKLMLNANVITKSPHVIGSTDIVTVSVGVKNEGEVAYASCVRVFVNGATMNKVPQYCVRPKEKGAHVRNNALLCSPEALRKDESWKIPDFSVDTSKLTSKDEFIEISVAVYDECNQGNASDWKNTTIPLLPDSTGIKIKGMTDSGLSETVNMTQGDKNGKPFQHVYIITSDSMTTWVDVTVDIVLEKRFFVEDNVAFFSNPDTKYCNASKSTKQIKTFTCKIGMLKRAQPTKIVVPMEILNSTLLTAAIRQKINKETTELTLYLNRGKKTEKIVMQSVTTAFYVTGQVKIWIIVVACIAGLLLLVVLFFILKKCGFFARDKKEKLADARKSVRRQTVIRRTIAEGMRAPTERDQQALLASVAEETAEQAMARDKRLRLDSNTASKRRGPK